MKILRLLAFSILLITLVVGLSYAQVLTGSIRGTVTDEEANPLPGVAVELSSPVLMGGIHTQITADKGTFRYIELPPGTYKLVLKLSGFQTVERLNIKVEVRGTVTENFALKPAKLEESVTVTGAAPIVDVTSTSMSTNYDKALLEKIPAGRNSMLDIIKQAPGMLSGADSDSSWAFSSYGSHAQSNSFQLDGLDLSSPRFGTSLFLPNQEIFAEVEVSGVGAPAEYGSFTGAVVNIVTKSGGNDFSGSLSYYGQYKGLTGENNPDRQKYSSFTRHQFFDGAVSLGGPIVKDKLWFFSSANVTRNDATNWQEDPHYHSPADLDNYYLKLSSQITQAHRLVGVFYYAQDHSKEMPTPFLMPESTLERKQHLTQWNLMYTWLLNSDTYLELKSAGFATHGKKLPPIGSILDPLHVDLLTGVISNGPYFPLMKRDRRIQIQASVSYFADEFLGKGHDFKVGVQFNQGYHQQIVAYPGDKGYLDYGGQPYILYQQAAFYYASRVDNIGVHFDDSWKITNRLTANIGLRYDNYKGHVPPIDPYYNWAPTGTKTPGKMDFIVWNHFSPRIGLVYQLTADGKTAVKAHYGRYVDALHNGDYEWPGPFNTDWFAYFWNGANWELFNYVPGSQSGDVDPNLKAPYTDQLAIGFERELVADFSLGLEGIYKKEKNLLGIVNTQGRYELVSMVSPDNNQTYQVYNQLNPGDNVYILANPKGMYMTYKGFILSLKKRYVHNWLLNASLTWSQSKGFTCISPLNYFEQVSVVTHAAYNLGKDPNDWTNGDGLLALDRPLVFKLQFGYTLPWDILIGANFQSMSGKPYVNYVRVYPDQGMRQIVEKPRDGSQRTPALYMLDLRAAKTFALYKNVRLQLMADIFNVLNTSTYLNYQSYNIWSSAYLAPAVIPSPRRAQIGVKLEF